MVFLTEFGRTPKINKEGGRDHWGTAGSHLLRRRRREGRPGDRRDRQDRRATRPRAAYTPVRRGRDDLRGAGHRPRARCCTTARAARSRCCRRGSRFRGCCSFRTGGSGSYDPCSRYPVWRGGKGSRRPARRTFPEGMTRTDYRSFEDMRGIRAEERQHPFTRLLDTVFPKLRCASARTHPLRTTAGESSQLAPGPPDARPTHRSFWRRLCARMLDDSGRGQAMPQRDGGWAAQARSVRLYSPGLGKDVPEWGDTNRVTAELAWEVPESPPGRFLRCTYRQLILLSCFDETAASLNGPCSSRQRRVAGGELRRVILREANPRGRIKEKIKGRA